tara:strand:+ start:426 stop:959 length:534 start_codon:yes stop_codon:yes gene_type:complete
MINYFIKILVLISYCLSQNIYKHKDLIKKDGLYCDKFSGKKISGEVYININKKPTLMGYILNGKKNGLWITWHKDGFKLEENFNKGLMDGRMSLFYKNGQRKWRHTFKNGSKDGLTTHWYPNGYKLKEGAFINGDSIGVWNFWNKNGNLIQQKHFRIRKKSLDLNSRSYIFKEDMID